MRKMYSFENVYCEHCAKNIQKAIKQIEGVKDCVLNYLAQKMVLEFELKDKERILGQIVLKAKEIVPEFELVF